MARWFKEHLGFKTTKAPPPAPPKPDYRHFHTTVSSPPGYQLHQQQQLQQQTSTGLMSAQPDILTAYKLRKELDFEDPYTGGGNIPFSTGLSSTGSPDVKYVSPKHRLIKVDTIERSCSSSGSSSGVTAVKSPTSPPAEPENGHSSSSSKQEKVKLRHSLPAQLAIVEDYADPFDAADQAGGTQTVTEKPTENDGYMEPYEAQKMMAEIRGGRGPKDGPVRQLPLYDTPYEPEENGGHLDGGRCSRESRLPQDDERPPEEYDQPWEWKKDRISKAFAVEIKVIKDLPWPPPVGQLNTSPPIMEVVEAPSPPDQSLPGQTTTATACDQHQHVQFDGMEKSRMSPTKEVKSRPLQRHSSGCLVNTKMSSLDHSTPTVGERIDPSMPLESQFWYHGAISRTDAESVLRLCKEASYLVRNSETSKNDFSLSLKSSQGFMHMKLSRTKDNKYVLGQNSCLFDSVPEIIYFYSSRKLPIKGAEHMSLLYPVAIRTL
ncbi:SH2 domain-containing adapter protein F-like isoform X2 [Myxocyprinus asiaticus]|uniref:SH2 domain-containing adapter protein F-like isoform X2 n=1 Tax=Myxocyprinus asiaticus TaxID=70543 RepID=UPI0022222A01|nr:SH2 domain-containing adapter protein F-like isoform X2 [Myxocyprinus asiaticus]